MTAPNREPSQGSGERCPCNSNPAWTCEALVGMYPCRCRCHREKSGAVAETYEDEGRCPACGEYVPNRAECARMDEHMEQCSLCFRLKDGTPVLCTDALAIKTSSR